MRKRTDIALKRVTATTRIALSRGRQYRFQATRQEVANAPRVTNEVAIARLGQYALNLISIKPFHEKAMTLDVEDE